MPPFFVANLGCNTQILRQPFLDFAAAKSKGCFSIDGHTVLGLGKPKKWCTKAWPKIWNSQIWFGASSWRKSSILETCWISMCCKSSSIFGKPVLLRVLGGNYRSLALLVWVHPFQPSKTASASLHASECGGPPGAKKKELTRTMPKKGLVVSQNKFLPSRIWKM